MERFAAANFVHKNAVVAVLSGDIEKVTVLSHVSRCVACADSCPVHVGSKLP